MVLKLNPKVSVIMPIYNAEEHLAASIRSVLSQTYNNLELVIVNDGSKDKSEEVVRTFVNRDDRIVYYFQENKGVAAARNTGLKASTGEWITYLDSDDLATPDRIERALNFTYRIGEKCLVYGGWFRFKVEGDSIRFMDYVRGYSDNFDLYKFQQKNLFVCSAVMHHRECTTKAGFFDEDLELEEDWDLWLRISDEFPVYQLDEPFLFRRIGDKEDYFKEKVAEKVVEECRDYITEKRIKKLLDVYNSSEDSEVAKRIFFTTLNVKNENIRREVLDRLESWRVYKTILGLVKTAPRQAFELLEKYRNDELISYIVREKIFDFTVPISGMNAKDFEYIQQVLGSFIVTK